MPATSATSLTRIPPASKPTEDGVLGGGARGWRSRGGRLPREPLVAPLDAGKAQDEQQHPGADDRADEADGMEAVHAHRVVLDQVLQEPADERADDAEHDGPDDADGVTARHEQARDRADDKPHDQQDDDEGNHVRMTSRAIADYALKGDISGSRGPERGCRCLPTAVRE